MIYRLSTIVVCFALLACNNMDLGSKKIIITTEHGKIEGFKDATTNLMQFYGVPYAKPPVGELRWKAPQPLKNWEGIKKTKRFADRALQTNVYGDLIYRSDTINEDCLYLNLWAPTPDEDKQLPVLVFFHGGDFIAGTGNEPRYDGASLAKKGVVVVTVNYRLNIFGFFAHPELSAEASYKASGNYGLLDQVAALKWVNKNIAAFGGNPNKVTIGGASAGSIAVSMHMISPLSKNLFSGAIGLSGAAIKPTFYPRALEEAEQKAVQFVESTKYKSIAELRKLGSKKVYKLYQKGYLYAIQAVVDGYFIKNNLPEAFTVGTQSQIPVLLGWTSGEMPADVIMQGEPLFKKDYIQKVKIAYPEHTEEILKHYPYRTKKEIEQSATNLASDIFIAYSTWKWYDLHKTNSNQPIYRYIFDQVRPSKQELIGAPHASDIEYFMGNLNLIDVFDWTEEDYKASETALNYLANFIKTGDPNGEGLHKWKNSNIESENIPVMNLKAVSELEYKNDARYFILDRIYKNNVSTMGTPQTF